MSITYQFARQFEGRPVMAHCRDGRRYYGIISRVTPESVHLRPLPNRGIPMSSHSIDNEITTAVEKDSNQELDIIETGPGFGYGPRGYGRPGYGYYGRGYGGYGYGGDWWLGAGLVLPLYVLLAISLFWW